MELHTRNDMSCYTEVSLMRKVEIARITERVGAKREDRAMLKISKLSFLPAIEKVKLTPIAKPAKVKKVKASTEPESKAYLYRATHCKLGAGVVISEDSDRIGFVVDGTDNVRMLLKSIGAAGMLTRMV